MSKQGDDIVEVKCPDCGATVRIPVAKAEQENKAVCPKGHEIPLAKMI